jgi:hypothetical protein
MYNNAFKIKLFTHFLDEKYPDSLNVMPWYQKGSGSSLWIEKV